MSRVLYFLFGAGPGLLAIALAALAWAKTAEEGRLRARLAAAEAAAAQAAACDQALLEAQLFVTRTACSTEVKTLFAHREAETRRADSLAAELARERADRDAAVARAEARAVSTTERKLRAEAALESAPRRDDRLVLDADRLRRLQGEPAE